jgi:serine/threonine protein kinase
MLSASEEDETSLEGLLGRVVPSDIVAGVSYRIVWRIGDGGMSVVFYALRVTADGEMPVVIKVLRPSFVQRSGKTAALIVKKEAIALGRLNERVPPTPFVVRFIDTGTFTLEYQQREVVVPWLVVEYVHGGAEGTTLSERVDNSLLSTGAAFDPARAAHAIDCLASGLVAVHEVGVIHRDLKPDNVLCCGHGEAEIFKIADFGVARPAGVATFSGAIVGTPGFVAPELTALDPKVIGPWSDIFSLAAVIFYILTGEEYFQAKNPADVVVQACNPARRSILETKGLSPELRALEQACRSIDFALACGSSAKIDARPRRADALAAMLLPWLKVESQRTSLVARRLDQIRDDDDPTQIRRWTWTTLRNPTRGLIIRNVAWDADGRCLTATSHGLAFWNGASWSEVKLPGLPKPTEIRFVQRIAAGQWLVGGEDATFITVSAEGITNVQRVPIVAAARLNEARSTGETKVPESPTFHRISGDFDDLALLVGSLAGGPPTLYGRIGKRWLRPLPLPDVAAIASITRVEDARFLIAGRGTDGTGYAAIYAPLDWEIQRFAGPNVRAYLSCAGLHERNTGLLVGAGGAVIWQQNGVITNEIVEGGYDLSAAGIDPVGRGWAASAGRIWLRRPGSTSARTRAVARWETLWCEPGWPNPIVSLFIDLGVVIAMTAEGGLIEGRLLRSSLIDDTDAD